MKFLTRLARRKLRRRLMGGSFPVNVPEAAFATARNDLFLTMLGNIGQQRTGVAVIDRGAAGNFYGKILAVAAIHFLAAPLHAFLGKKKGRIIKALERILVVIAPENNMGPAAAIAAVRASFFYTRFAPEAAATVAALPGAHMHAHAIDKLVRFHRRGGEDRIADALCARRCRRNRNDAAFFLKLDQTIHEGEQRKIASLADVGASVDLGPALPHKDGTGGYELAVKALYTQTFATTVATITC